MSFKVSFVILLGLVVLCLMALFLCGIVLFVSLIALQLGGYQLLVRLVVWLLLILVLLVIVVVRSLH